MEKRYIKPEDLYAFKNQGDVQISVDGNCIAYVVQRFNRKEDESLTDIFVYEVDSKKTRQITFTGKNSSPVFAPDGQRLAFISKRNEKSQIWILDLNGGEAWCLKTKETVSGPLIWTPDGGSIIYSAEVFSHEESWIPYPGAPEYDRERIVKLSEKLHEEKKKSDEDKKENKVKVITRFNYRFDGVGYYGDVRQQVFITPVPTTPDPDWEGQSRQLTEGDYNHDSAAISPNGKYLAAKSRQTETADMEKKSDIWVFEIDNGNSHLLYDAPGPVHNLSWSPCGNYLAFVGHDLAEDLSTTSDLWILGIGGYIDNLERGEAARPLTVENASNVTRSLDRPIGGQGSDMRYKSSGSLGWQGDKLFFLLSDRGVGCIYRIVPSAQAEPILVDRKMSISSLAVGKEFLVYSASSPVKPEELYIYRKDEIKQLTTLNQDLLREIEIGSWEEFTYKSDDGQSIDGWIIYPPKFNPEEIYPLVLLVHGGPHGAYGPGFMFTAQIFAAENYVVLYTNPRGSQTYGQEFASCIDKNWGDRDYADVMAGVDAVIERGFVDTERMFAHGWSYGGYLTCWIATQTDCFKAICAGASVTNMISQYGCSDITLADERECGGQPWRDYEHFIQHSPLGHVENVQTPMMLMHGENDYRVPVGQTEEFYIALKRLGKEVIMIRYPGEYHGPRRLIHKLDRYERLLAWFNYYRDLK